MKVGESWSVDETTCIKPACCSQLAGRKSVNNTCNRLVIIKPERAMRTDLDIGVVIADLLQLAHFWLCITAQPLYKLQAPHHTRPGRVA